MTFVSYAQNFEDVMLHRALKQVERGFYVDIGAQDPVSDSVTKAFYVAGWRGINVEPVTAWAERLKKDRPEDVNLQVAAGNQRRWVRFYEVVDTGLSTTDRDLAEKHARERGYEVRESSVEELPLAEILAEHARGEIHFLKVDAEGMEARVLRGNDWTRFRPWIVLLESTLPNQQIETHQEWEPILLDAGYRLAYRDGLNRFYVAREHEALLASFEYPPNVFDEFRTAAQHEAETRIMAADARASWSQARAIQAEARVEVLENELEGVYTSRSWRVTIPMRAVMHLVRKFLLWSSITARAVAPFLRRALIRMLVPVGRFIESRPYLKRIVAVWIARLAVMKQSLRGDQQERMQYMPVIPAYSPSEELSPRVAAVLHELKSRVNPRLAGTDAHRA
jgi:FkbM family methyltransferase